jgi:5-methylcytosine-specific restriction endonuclease McrA
LKLPGAQVDALLARARRLLKDHRARARRVGAALDYGLAQLRALLADSPCCAYCHSPVAWDAQVDHRTPTSRGGSHSLNNLSICCARCNSLKGLLTEDEFRQLRELLALLHPRAAEDLARRLIAGGARYGAR